MRTAEVTGGSITTSKWVSAAASSTASPPWFLTQTRILKLPAESWWTHYQTPLEAKFPVLREKYADDPEALAVVEEAATEHRICRQYPGTYGYEFYIARATD